MNQMKLPCGRIAKIDDEDLPLTQGRNWFSLRNRGKTYVRGRLPGQRGEEILLHKLILGLGRGEICDFKNGDGLDCRKENLRPCTQGQNTMNSGKKRPYKKYKGVFWDKRKDLWYAQIAVTEDGERKRYFGGHFASEVMAAKAYDDLAIVHHGEFANLNFPR